MSTMTNEVGLELLRANKALAQRISESNALARLQQPQVWTSAMLRAHYPGLSDERLRSLLETHCGYRGARGVRLTATLDQVLRLDDLIAKRGSL